MSGPVRVYSPAEIAEWEANNVLPPPVLRLNVLRAQRRAREIEQERARRFAASRAARTPTPA